MAGHHECLPSASHTRYDDAIEFIDGHAGTDGRTRLIVGRRASARDIFAALPIGGSYRIATQFGCAAGSARWAWPHLVDIGSSGLCRLIESVFIFDRADHTEG